MRIINALLIVMLTLGFAGNLTAKEMKVVLFTYHLLVMQVGPTLTIMDEKPSKNSRVLPPPM